MATLDQDDLDAIQAMLWSAAEREQIRHRLGIDGVATEPAAVPSLAAESTQTYIRDTLIGIQHSTASKFESIYPWVVDANGTNPRVNDPTISFSETFPTNALLRVRELNALQGSDYRLIGEWDGATWTIDGGWDGAPLQSGVLYLSYSSGDTPLPKGTLTISVPSVIGDNPRIVTVPLPYWEDSRDLDLIVHADGTVAAWRGGAIKRESINKNITSITYNPDGTMNVITFSDNTTLTFGYDVYGRKVTATYG